MKNNLSTPASLTDATSLIHEIAVSGHSLSAIKQDSTVWVSVRSVCAALGIDTSGQARKLAKKTWATLRADFQHLAADGKMRQMILIDVECLPMWLSTIEAGRVSVELGDRLLTLQKRAAVAVKEHFFGTEKSAGPKVSLKCTHCDLLLGSGMAGVRCYNCNVGTIVKIDDKPPLPFAICSACGLKVTGKLAVGRQACIEPKCGGFFCPAAPVPESMMPAPVSGRDHLVAQAEALVVQAKAIVTQRDQIAELRQMVTTLIESRAAAASRLLLAPSSEKPPTIPMRRWIESVVGELSDKIGKDQHETWRVVYRGLKLHYGTDAYARARNASKAAGKEVKKIDVLENAGLLGEVYATAKELLRQANEGGLVEGPPEKIEVSFVGKVRPLVVHPMKDIY